ARVQACAPNCLFAALLPRLESMDKRCQKVGVAKSAVLSGGFADLKIATVRYGHSAGAGVRRSGAGAVAFLVSARITGVGAFAGRREAQLSAHAEEPTRRDFLTIAGGAFAAVGGAMALWPFIAQMNPDASTQALASVEVDLTPVQPGQAITVMWRGKPVFIRNRTPEDI